MKNKVCALLAGAIVSLLGSFASADIIRYEVSGSVTSSTGGSPNEYVGASYKVDIVYNSDAEATSTNHYFGAVYSASLEIGEEKFCKAFYESTYYAPIRYYPELRFEQLIDFERVVPSIQNPGGYEYAQGDEVKNVYSEIVLHDNDGVYPAGESLPTTLDLNQFEKKFASFDVGGVDLTCTIETIAFTTITGNTVNVASPYFGKRLLYSNTWEHYTAVVATPQIPGTKLRWYQSLDMSSWTERTGFNSLFAFGGPVELRFHQRSGSEFPEGPSIEKAFYQVTSSYSVTP
ncbi:hypothetical protein SAMN02745181_2242 [Rubritalea squalenifaciens DSM 18772]|uniref:Uncharacterized protein n=1 Tax=Rubritalea squalenifaciens DSM 18772 TaxID=1123071 RepID=A0A1M6KYN5_9BACT|nr:hypothetical protein [Rubritalea squalenifaciens]SHJ64057.1 hypothetical protein SAMN02745181_2242 [Rubritalea squalenifaciens DSM 18772]